MADPTPAPAPGGSDPVLTERPRSVLEEEREFFLRSLRDLEAEHDAGDIDDIDYQALKEDYTVRAAAVLRQLDAPAARPAPPVAAAPTPTPDPGSPPVVAPHHRAGDPGAPGCAHSSPRRWLVLAAIAVAAGGLGGWAVSASSGGRLPGQTVSGQAVGTEKVGHLLLAAEQAAASGHPVAALKDCRSVLAEEPNQPQALAEEGWLLAQTQQPDLQAQGLGDLNRAVALDPADGTAHLYRGVVLLDVGRRTDAVGDLHWYLDHHPDPAVRPRVEAALARATAAP